MLGGSIASGGSYHCHTKQVLSEPRPTTPGIAQNFSDNMRSVMVGFVTDGSLPAPFRRLAAVTNGSGSTSFADGGFVIGGLNAELTIDEHPKLKDRCDFWRSTGVLEHYAWNE